MSGVEQEDLVEEEDCYASLFNGLVYYKFSEFQRRVCRVLKVGRINNVNREPIIKGRVLGCATNKFLSFVADTGTPVAITPHSVAERNKLKFVPADEDKPSYAGVTDMRLSVVGQTTIYIDFMTMKTTKKLRAIVVADEGSEALVDMEALILWGVIQE